MELLIARVKLRPATYADLAVWEEDVKIRLQRQQFFVKNAEDKLECYRLEQFTDPTAVKDLIDNGRVYVFMPASLVHNTDAEIVDVEVVSEAA